MTDESTLVLDVASLTKRYEGPQGEVRVLSNYDLKISKGEFVAVRGPSGCGKSTLLLAAGGLLSPESGQVKVDGTDLYQLSRGDRSTFRADKIGFVFQQFHLIPYLSVLDNALTPSLENPGNDSLNRARQLLDEFGLKDRLDHVPGQLSTGEKQRVAMVRALLNSPSLVLADEPTGNLDAENSKVILDRLKDFAQQGGAVLLVTHDDQAAEAADRVIQLESVGATS